MIRTEVERRRAFVAGASSARYAVAAGAVKPPLRLPAPRGAERELCMCSRCCEASPARAAYVARELARVRREVATFIPAARLLP